MTVPASQAAKSEPVEQRREAALDQACALLPEVRAHAAAADEDRRVPDSTIAALLEADLFNVLTPRSFGGRELGIETLVRITTELGSACGSTGWVYGVLAGHSWLLNLFPVEAQREVFADLRTLTATVFRLSGEIGEVDDGYRLIDGAGRFCSGIDFASWIIVGGAVQRDALPPEPRFFIIPRSDVEIIDDWHTVGMRGTGSRSIRVSETFIPAHRSVSLEELLAGGSAGAQIHESPLYRMPFQLVTPFSIIGAPLGMARNAVTDASAMLGKFLDGQSELQVAGRSASLARLGTAAAQTDAAFSLVIDDARSIDTARKPASLDAQQRDRIPRNWAYAAQTARAAVNLLFEASGGSSIYDASALQRIWRDVNAATQHFAFTWDAAMTDSGRAMLGLPTMGMRPGQRN